MVDGVRHGVGMMGWGDGVVVMWGDFVDMWMVCFNI